MKESLERCSGKHSKFFLLLLIASFLCQANADGAVPFGGLLLSSNTLYGIASAGGAFGGGTIFSISLPVTGLTPTIAAEEANIILSWPANASGFTLQSTPDLLSPAWTAISATPVVINGQNTVTNHISGTQQFFRLGQ